MWQNELEPIKKIRIESDTATSQTIGKQIGKEIVSFLSINKDIVFDLLKRSTDVSSDDINNIVGGFKIFEEIIRDYGSRVNNMISSEASDYVKKELGIRCHVSLHYDYDITKWTERMVKFTLSSI